MKRWIGVTAIGELVRDTITEGIPEQLGVIFMEVELTAPVNISLQYLDGLVFKDKGVAPPLHKFDYTLKQWVDPRTLMDFKTSKWASIKNARDAAISTPLVTPYGTFDADPKSQTAITSAVLMLQTLQGMGQPTTIDFTLADNTTVTLNTAKVVEVGLLLGQQVQASFAKGRALRTMIDSTLTKEAVENINW